MCKLHAHNVLYKTRKSFIRVFSYNFGCSCGEGFQTSVSNELKKVNSLVCANKLSLNIENTNVHNQTLI